MTDIFHEVEEDLRRDRLNKVWARYGSVFLTIAVLAVAATAGYVWWRGHQQATREGAGETFAAADKMVASGDLDAGLQAYADIAAPGTEGYPALAMFRQASLLAAKNDLQGALAVYDKIASGPMDERLKALAQIRAAFTVADIEEPDVLKKRVEPFMGDDNPWRFEARELAAFADFRARRNEAAAAAYGALAADADAPQTLRDRAGKMASFLNGGAVLPVEATQPAAPSEPAAPPESAAPTEAAPAETSAPTPAPKPQAR